MPFGNSHGDYMSAAQTGFGSLPEPSNQSQKINDVLKKTHPNLIDKKQKKLPKNFKWQTKKPGYLWDPDN